MLTNTLCAALSAAGLALAVTTAYRRRYLRATRIAALALLPVGLALAGLVTLGRRVGTAIGDWAADLVFKPTVWIGFGVLACSVLLYGIARLVSGRGGGRRPQAAAGQAAPGATPRTQPPALPEGGSAPAGKRRGSADGGLSGFEDVEEILKRRGI
jgi:hypothetical protein